jgi:hypothetical protein
MNYYVPTSVPPGIMVFESPMDYITMVSSSYAEVMELVDIRDLKSRGDLTLRVGSIPTLGTLLIEQSALVRYDLLNAPVAQLVEQLPLKEMVVGSNPTGRTTLVQCFVRDVCNETEEGFL